MKKDFWRANDSKFNGTKVVETQIAMSHFS